MKLLPVTALLSLLAAAPALGADARPAKPDFRYNVPDYELQTKVFDFPTGLRIMFQSDRSHPVVTTFMVVNHGSKDDPEGKEETAHFVEHTWFRSKHGDLPPIMDVIQDLGAMFNATTRNDWTDYRTVSSSENLPLMLRLESARLTEPYKGVTEEEIDVEREVIRNEWRRRNEQSSSLFVDYLYSAVYPKEHGYHDHSTHGSIDNIKLADLQKFMDDYYKPENTTLFVVGDFDPEEAYSLIFDNFALELLDPRLKEEHLFKYPRPGIENPDQNNPSHYLTGAWDPASDPKDPDRKTFQFTERTQPRITDQRPPVPEVGTREVLTEQGPFDMKTVVVGWSLPGGFRSDHWNLQAVGSTASQYVAGAFYEEVDNKQIRDVGCFAMPEVLNTTVACYAELADKKLDPLRVRDKMLDQLSEIWNPEMLAMGESPFFVRAKLGLMADLLLSLDLFAQEFGGRAEEITPHAHYTNSPRAHTDGMNQIASLQQATIAKLASEYLKRDRAATVILEPLPEEDIDIGSESSTYRGASATDQVIRSTDDLDAVTEDQIAASYIKPGLDGLQDFTLPNGLRVIVLEHGEAPTVEVSMLFGRDGVTEPKGLFDFVADFSQSAGHDPLPIAASTSWYTFPGVPGVPAYGKFMWGASRFNDGFMVNTKAPSGNLDGALWLLREEVETSHAYVDRKGEYVKDSRDGIKAGWRDMDWHLEKARNEYLYPNHPSGRMMGFEDIDVMAEWSGTTVDEYLANHLQPKNATLMIVGNVDADKAHKMAETYFGGWAPRKAAGEPPAKPTPAGMPTAPSKILVFDESSRTQTDVTTSCRLNFTDPSQEMAVSILGSLLRNRTFSTMRIQEGLAYSPGAYAGIGSDGSASLTFYSDGVVNSGTGRMLQFYNQAIAEVEQGKVDMPEVKLHKLRMARSDGVAAQSMDQMTGTLTEVVRKGKGWDFATDRGDLIATVKPEDLTALIQGCAEHSITTIVGPKDVVTPQLDELGLKYELVQWRADADELLWQYDPKAAKKREKDRQKADKKAAKDDAKKPPADEKKPAGDAAPKG